MAMTAGKLHELTGQRYEDVFMQEVSNFRDADRGVSVDGEDVAAALILRDTGRLDLLDQLHDRRIHVIGEVEEDSEFEDLEFETV